MSNQVQVDLSKFPNEKCSCGSVFFKQVLLIRRVPGLLIGSSQDQIANIAILVCDECNEVFKENQALINLYSKKEIIK